MAGSTRQDRLPYSTPQKFTLDKSNGLYYKSDPGSDQKTGTKGRWITWYNPDTGKYWKQFYPD
jgi:hypothetical protein